MSVKSIIHFLASSSIFLFSCNSELSAQNSVTNEKKNRIEILNSCSYYNKSNSEEAYFFNPEIEAEHTIEKILKLVGLPSNFTIKRANIENAMATIILTNSGTFERFILYDQNFMNSVKLSTGNDFSQWSILAHEIGHHLSGHTLTSGGDSHTQELEADEFSGFVMYKMGATLPQAQSAINKFCSNEGSISHPPKKYRLLAVETGWYNAKNSSPNSNGISGGSTSDILTYQGSVVVMIIQSAKSGENVKQEIIGTKPILQYIASSKKWQISYTDEQGNFTMMELSHIKDTEDGAIMKDTYDARYSVTNGVNADGMLFCQLLDIKGEAFAYISFEGLKRK
jgi:hypothetical protein